VVGDRLCNELHSADYITTMFERDKPECPKPERELPLCIMPYFFISNIFFMSVLLMPPMEVLDLPKEEREDFPYNEDLPKAEEPPIEDLPLPLQNMPTHLRIIIAPPLTTHLHEAGSQTIERLEQVKVL